LTKGSGGGKEVTPAILALALNWKGERRGEGRGKENPSPSLRIKKGRMEGLLCCPVVSSARKREREEFACIRGGRGRGKENLGTSIT